MNTLNSSIHADEYKSWWYRQEYVLDRGFLKPQSQAIMESYNPFDYYYPSIKGIRTNQSLHYEFANLNLNNEQEIINFYCKYGPLGLFDSEIVRVVSYNPAMKHYFKFPEHSPYVGIERLSDAVIPMGDLIDTFHIPEEKFLPIEEDDIIVPDIEVTSFDTWESVQDFRSECNKFKGIIELLSAINDKNTNKMKEFFNNDRAYSQTIDENADDKKILHITAAHVITRINGKIRNMINPFLNFNDDRLGISKNITWHCQSLLACLYLMVFLDITKGAYTRKCKHCGTFFESAMPNAACCPPVEDSNGNVSSCQKSAKSKRQRDDQRKALNLREEGFSKEEIITAIKKDSPTRKEETIRKWIDVMK